MSHEDRQWLEGRIRDLRDGVCQDVRDMESRIVHQIEGLKSDHTHRLNDHANRIRALEISRGYIAGIGAGIGFALSWLRDVVMGGRQ